MLFSGSGINLCFPFMTFVTLPPCFFVTSRKKMLRFFYSVFYWMPFLRNFGVSNQKISIFGYCFSCTNRAPCWSFLTRSIANLCFPLVTLPTFPPNFLRATESVIVRCLLTVLMRVPFVTNIRKHHSNCF
jgi:hypothetical protein